MCLITVGFLFTHSSMFFACLHVQRQLLNFCLDLDKGIFSAVENQPSCQRIFCGKDLPLQKKIYFSLGKGYVSLFFKYLT